MAPSGVVPEGLSRGLNSLLDVERAPSKPEGPPSRWDSAVRQQRSARWAARLVTFLGLVSVVDAVSGPFRGRLDLITEVLPPLAPQVAAVMTIPLGLILIQLSVGL